MIAVMFLKKCPFGHAYLLSIKQTKTSGKVKYHLVIDYDTTADGKVFPITSGSFTKKVCLPFPGGYVDNLWLCLSVENYLEKIWLKEICK